MHLNDQQFQANEAAKQRLIEKRENAAVVKTFAVVRMHAVAFLIGKTEGGNVVEDLSDDGGCFRIGGLRRGGRLLLLLDIFGGFAGKFAGKPREVQLAAGAAREQRAYSLCIPV